MSDAFRRSDRNLNGDISPWGEPYVVQFDPGDTRLVIRGERMVRGNAANFGPDGAPVLTAPGRVAPTVVGMSYVFTPGATRRENAVVGVCTRSFGYSSVQFAVYPGGWVLFYAQAGSALVDLASGQFATPLATDAQTVYQTVMSVDLANSSVTVDYPGATQTFTDPAIAQHWGTLAGFQVRHPAATDGDVQVLSVTAGATGFAPFS